MQDQVTALHQDRAEHRAQQIEPHLALVGERVGVDHDAFAAADLIARHVRDVDSADLAVPPEAPGQLEGGHRTRADRATLDDDVDRCRGLDRVGPELSELEVASDHEAVAAVREHHALPPGRGSQVNDPTTV